MTTVLCTRVPETAVTVMLYVPGVALVTTGVVELDEPPEEEPEPHPDAVTAAMDTKTASKAAQRRRLGAMKRSVHASVAPEPAAYHGM